MKKATIFTILSFAMLILSGCAAKDPVTHNPGWQVPDDPSEDEGKKEGEINLQEIF